MRRMYVASMLLAVFLTMVGAASASALKLCVPRKQGSALVTPKHGRCTKGYKLTTVGAEGREGKPGARGKPGAEGKTGPEGKAGTTGFSDGELETLRSLLPHIKFVGAGVGGKPTIQFSAVNVQVVNGEGKTASVNGEGNLVIGYDEDPGLRRSKPGVQTGSHNLILGEEQEFTSAGGIVAGELNTITAPFASITGGIDNSASEVDASVSGGFDDSASGGISSVSGGTENTASGAQASISGGEKNDAKGFNVWIGGGRLNVATEVASSVGGGDENEALANFSWIGGGQENVASGEWASVSGGGGNHASGKYSSILGEKNLTASKEFEALK